VAQEDVALPDLSRLVFSRYKATRGRALGPPSVLADEYRVLSRGHKRLEHETDRSSLPSSVGFRMGGTVLILCLHALLASKGAMLPLPSALLGSYIYHITQQHKYLFFAWDMPPVLQLSHCTVSNTVTLHCSNTVTLRCI